MKIFSVKSVKGKFILLNENNEEKTIMDFNDRYSNFSAFPLNQQVQYFETTLNTMLSSDISKEKSILLAVVFCLYLDVMSTSKKDIKIFEVVDESVFKFVYETYKAFHKNNAILSSNDFALSNCPPNEFDFILINLDLISKEYNNIFKDACSLLKKTGKLLLYSFTSNSYQIGEFPYRCNDEKYDIGSYGGARLISSQERQETPLNILQETTDMSNCLNTIYDILKKSEQNSDEWYKAIDVFIDGINSVESYIAARQLQFKTPELKYTANELKNAALDLKFEKKLYGDSYDYFKEILEIKMNEWNKILTENI